MQQQKVQTRELWSYIDMQTHAGLLGLGFDLLTSGSVHAKVLLCTIYLPTSVLIAQVVFLLERRQTNRRDWMADIQLAWVMKAETFLFVQV